MNNCTKMWFVGRTREDDILMIGPGGEVEGENPYLGYLPDILHGEGVLSYMLTIPPTSISLFFVSHLKYVREIVIKGIIKLDAESNV